VVVLGGGRIEPAPRALFCTQVLWTDADDATLQSAAEALGYERGTSMAFLRLRAVAFPGEPSPVHGLVSIVTRLNVATHAYVAALSSVLPIS
jgi:hypothetical protein